MTEWRGHENPAPGPKKANPWVPLLQHRGLGWITSLLSPCIIPLSLKGRGPGPTAAGSTAGARARTPDLRPQVWWGRLWVFTPRELDVL